MTLNQAYRVLRQLQDWRTGADCRTMDEVGIQPNIATQAIEMILAANGQPNKIADCSSCKHCDCSQLFPVCGLKVMGDCDRYEQNIEL